MEDKDVTALPRNSGEMLPAQASASPSALAKTKPLQVESRATLTLQDAIAETLTAPAVLAAAENVTQASAALWTASTPPNPTFNTSSTLMPLNREFTRTRQGGPPQFDAGLSFPIDWLVFGKRSAAMESARLGVDQAGADFADLVRQRLAATVAAFYDILEAEALLELARKDIENLRQIAKITEQQVQLGGIGFIEADRIHLALLDSEREAQRREAAALNAKAALKAALGRDDGPADYQVAGKLEVATAQPPPPVEDAFKLAAQYRPDVVAMRLKVSKAEADIHLEENKALPQITPAIGYTRQFQEKAIGFPDANSWGVGVAVSVPIFDRNQGGIRTANSVLAQSRYNLQDQLAQLHAEVAQAVEEFRVAHGFVTSDTAARVATAKSVRDRIEMAYQAGGRSLLEMLDAQRTYRDITRSAILDQAAYWKSLHRLNAAIGKQIVK